MMDRKRYVSLHWVISLFLLIAVSIPLKSRAEEGMWIPTLLEKYNMQDLQKLGFKLSAKDIYDVNHSSLKDAVVLFGGGCTGEIVSSKGLVLTNHHCGYASIQALSSVENNLLKDGFWAYSQKEELAVPSLKVRFLERMEDVSQIVLKGVDALKDQSKQKELIEERCDALIKQYSKDEFTEVSVKPILYGNQYFMYIYKIYKDVRLVGAPPSSIGKFGGDTDNWVWPRHTGDFSMFRIYATKEGAPANYSADNVPLQSKNHLKIKLGELNEGDPTMVMGYPGKTQLYLPSPAISMYQNVSFPTRISIRDLKLSTWKESMNKDPKVDIQYASKCARTANGWKKWQGAILGLSRFHAIERKQEQEKQFQAWVNEEPNRIAKYGHILSDFDSLYNEFVPYHKRQVFYEEIVERGADIFELCSILNTFIHDKDKGLHVEKKDIIKKLDKFYKDYDPEVDANVLGKLLVLYKQNIDPKYYGESMDKVSRYISKGKFASRLYNKSFLVDSAATKSFIRKYKRKDRDKLTSDPIFHLKYEMDQTYVFTSFFKYQYIKEKISATQKLYVKALQEMNGDQPFMADANLTMRVSYGQIKGYNPKDGVYYSPFTTLKGVYQKSQQSIVDYQAPKKLIALYKEKNYGVYANKNGNLPVAFCASNHTTGGNSGSPVLNVKGELIGVNFDRCWDGTMSDLMFDPRFCRNIILDVRYVLFVIDKYAGATNLIEEMDIVE
ncbi:MAG: S46 family peptidase [Prolixibacteraceae bacterium]